MFQSMYYIDKSSNTFADNLAAFGLAFILNGITDGRAMIYLKDLGPCFGVECQPALKPEWVENASFFTGAPLLVTTKEGNRLLKGTDLKVTELPPPGDLVVDYEEEKQARVEFFTLRNEWIQAEKRARSDGIVLGDAPKLRQPHPQWDIFRAVNPAALQGYNGLMAEWWQTQEAFPDLLKVILQMTASFPNDIEGAQDCWKKLAKTKGWKTKDATAMQLFNPSQGKGSASLKTTWSSPGNLKNFWLLEWLKVVGLFYGGMTRSLGKSKDRKTYVLSPVNLEWQRHVSVMKDFRDSLLRSETSVKMDILVALRYTQAFLRHYEGARTTDLAAAWMGQRPSDLVAGMQTAYYKNLGNSPATMNIAAINLPRWVVLNEPADMENLQVALEEHARIVSSLDETRGDQFSLLTHYRDFISGNDLDPFFEFTTAYSGFLISQRERGRYVRPFTTTTLEVLFMNSDDDQKSFSHILQDPGFKNIAYAIRHSTVIPQFRKGQGNRPAVEIRYGLGQQLARKATYPEDFLTELNEFLLLYNAENAQLREKGRHTYRKDVTTTDLDAITRLVDCFGSRLVCNMLVAYGYAADRKSTEPTDKEVEQDVVGSNGDESIAEDDDDDNQD